MKRREKNEAGTVLITFALFLIVLLGFTALGMEVGRWFMVRAELSKSVDAAALVAAKNLSNPFVDPRTLAAEFGAENFASGSLGTPASGTGSVNFNVQLIEGNRVQVDGHVSARAMLAQLFGFNLIPVSSSGVGQQKRVEIMLVLDRSGSMAGTPIRDLKRAATTFVSFFASTQDQDRMGLISFATSVTVVSPLGTNYVAPMTTAINAMTAVGATNAEDAIDQADGPQGFTDQTGIPGDRRVQQFLIFFSDGRPTAFRGSFMTGSTTRDAVACVTANCVPGDNGGPGDDLGRPDAETWLNVDPSYTGDGVNSARCDGRNTLPTTRWYIFDTQPVPGYAATAQCIPDRNLHDHACNLASGMALRHAQELKDERVAIYAIGLGSQVNRAFLETLATSRDFVYYAPTSDQLQAIFQMVAREIKLRLVQ